jgi:CAI-1 autoinducer synthase
MQVLERTLSPATRAFPNPALGKTLSERIARDFSARWAHQWGGKFVLHGRAPGASAVRLDGNDYLGVTGHPEIVQAQIAALTRNNESVVQSGVFFTR